MATNRYPCVEAIHYVLLKFMGAAKLIAQVSPKLIWILILLIIDLI
jgi:hypothetical protein